MTSRHDSKTYNLGEGSLVDSLALSVISQVSDGNNRHRNRRLDVGASILFSAIMEDRIFDQDQTKADLQALRISANDIIDHCIPQAARLLGEGWANDTISFTKVTIASARLYGLCKHVGQAWDDVRPSQSTRTVLLATVEREDHMIGAAVLTEQLRRRGHSVRVLQNTTASKINEVVQNGQYDGILISVSSLTTLDYAKKEIKTLVKQKYRIPIVVGGACLSVAGTNFEKIGADVVTNDIDTALDAMARNDVHLRVAE